MELKEYLRIIWARRNLIATVALVCLIIATLGGLQTAAVYEAKATVLVKSALSPSTITVSGFQFAEGADMQIKASTFGEILTSRTIAERIVERLGLEQPAAGPKKKRGAIRRMRARSRDLIQMLKYGKVTQPDPHRALVGEIQAAISTRQIPKTSVLEIIVQLDDPQLAADIANAAAEAFVEHMRKTNSEEASMTREFITGRVTVATEDLQAAQDALRNFIAQEAGVYPEAKVTLALTEMVRFESMVKQTETDIEQLNVHVEMLRGRLARFSDSLTATAAVISNPMVQELNRRLVDLEIQRTRLAASHGPLHPRMVALDQEVAKVKSELEAGIGRIVNSETGGVSPLYDKLLAELITKENDLSIAQERKDALAAALQTFPPEITLSARKQIDWDTLELAVKFAHKNLDALKTRLEQARITEAQRLSEISVIDSAAPNPYPTGLPRVAFPLLGLLVGLAGGVGLALLLEYADDSVKDIAAIEEGMKLPVYAVIPRIRYRNKRGKGHRRGADSEEAALRMIEERLVTHFEPQSPVAEAYRSFRTNIQFCGVEERPPVFLVSSSQKGEGKTTTVANMGITLAQLGSKVLLVDGDMRNPMLARVFGLAREPGLSNLLGGAADVDEVIRPSGVENLDVLAGGLVPPNPSELLSTDRVRDLIQALRQRYELILLDTPPIIAVTDAAILSAHAHGVFIVIRAGRTSRRLCMRAVDLFRKVNASLLGVVMNDVSAESAHGHEYYYQQYYRHDGRA